MASFPSTTPMTSDRAAAALNAIAGRASGARVVLSSALELLDGSRASGEIAVSNVARERLGRLLLEVAAKTNEFQRVIEELKGEQS